MSKIPVAILGATGAVGQRFIQLLENHPWFEVAEVVASDRSAGMIYREATRWILDGYPPRSIMNLAVKSIDSELTSPVVFSALPSNIAQDVEIRLAAAGHVVCSNASSHRMAADVPLIIPEVNAGHVCLIDTQRQKRGWSTGALVTNSNCTSMPITMALAPLLDYKPDVMHVVSMQAVSGAGYPGVASLDIYDNVIPFIKNEEEKLEEEPRKMLGSLSADGQHIHPLEIKVSAACNRVPVLDAHLVSIAVHFKEQLTLEDIHAAWRDFRGSELVQSLPSSPALPVEIAEGEDRPQPRRDRYAGNGMATVVGRLRPCATLDGVQFVALGHNTIRGAAGCSIFNAELLLKTGYIQAVN